MLSMEGSAPREERRVVTALFADLVGSTALGERLDPEELKLIVADAVARMIGVIESFDGNGEGPCGRRRPRVLRSTGRARGRPRGAVRAGLRITEEIADYARDVERAW